MNPTFQALRAIGAEFARRIYVPVAVVIGVIGVAALALSFWLTTIDAWWWILFVLVALLACFWGAVLIIAWLIIRFISPSRTKTQKQKVKAFVDKLQGLSEVVQTPKFILLFRVIRDAVIPNEKSYVRSVAEHTRELKQDFQDISQSFEEA